MNLEYSIGEIRCTVDVAGVGSYTTAPLGSTLTKVGSNLSQGFVEGIEFHHAASMSGNAVEKSVVFHPQNQTIVL